jgi:PAS domain S-box-containing protein
MMHPALSERKLASALLPITTAALAAVIYVVDTIMAIDIAVAVLFVAVVLMAARFCRPRGIVLVAAGCVCLTVLSYALSAPAEAEPEGAINTIISIAVISLTTLLVVQARLAEVRLREQASLLDLTHDTIFVRGIDDVITYWNRGAAELYGWTREEALGKVSHQLMQTTFPAPLGDINAELFRTGRWEGELVHTTRDGTRVTVSSRWSLQRNDQGRPAMILETNNNISEQKRADELLRESERRYRNIFETAGVSIWEQDFSRVKAAMNELTLQGVRDHRAYLAAHPEFVRKAISMVKVVDVNHATLALFQAESKDELLGSLDAIVTPGILEAFVGGLIVMAEGQTCFASEAEVKTLKGDKLAVLFTITCPPQPARLDSVLVTITDITERKRAEDELRYHMQLLKTVTDNASSGLYMVDPEERGTFANPSLERVTGYRAEELIGQIVHDKIHHTKPDGTPYPLHECPLMGAARQGHVVRGEDLFVRKDGTFFPVRYTVSPLLRDGVPAGSVIECQDLTQSKQAEQALHEARTELAHVARLMTMGELTATIAHEVNQPLAALVTNSSACLRWLAREPPAINEARACLDRVVRDGHRAGEVITRIRSLVKKSPPVTARLDLNEAIEEVLAIIGPEARRSMVLVRAELAASLPPVQGDRVQLQQVILNLAMNGIEALSKVADRQRELWIKSRPHEAETVLVSVQDNGVGLAAEGLERVLEAFYTTKAEGIGIGLSISRSIIEAHGGRLWPAANNAQGATFHFTLPAEQRTVGLRVRAGEA